MVVPVIIPVSIPDEEPIVPTAVLLLAHVPPVEELVKDTLVAGQRVEEPPIVAGNGFTDMFLTRKQPLVGCV
jgi:hypothetical protein